MDRNSTVNELESVETSIARINTLNVAQKVVLGSKSSNGDRSGPIFSRSYTSQKKYNKEIPVMSMYLNFKTYLALKISKGEEYSSCLFGILDVSYLFEMLEMLEEIALKENYIFVIKKDALYLNQSTVDEHSWSIMSIGNNEVVFEFMIIDDTVPGLKVKIGGLSELITIDELSALNFIFNKMDMFSNSLKLLEIGLQNKKTTFELKQRKL